MDDLYKALGVLPDSEDIVIRGAYSALVKKYHPDVYRGDKGFAEQRTKELNFAFEVLRDTQKRDDYDAKRHRAEQAAKTAHTQPAHSGRTPPLKYRPYRHSFAAFLFLAAAAALVWAMIDQNGRISAPLAATITSPADLIEAFRTQAQLCWSSSVGVPNKADRAVDFKVNLNQDGTIIRAVSNALSSNDPYTRSAAEAARRAIFTCQPYSMPQNRYKEWHEIPLRLDASSLVH